MSKYTKLWSGTFALPARARWAASIAAGTVHCYRCGQLIQPGQVWHVDHKQPLSLGGDLADPDNQWPSHATCNNQHGAHLTNAQVRNKRARIRA